ncbi:MAG: FKBP-type peptidyl-prolyl cis-trans isomerase [Paludibacteraceae bacterium]|nr:FKBP-type peptidyl-prolyl cis-trans isomerase [Paludibacteraceae bacterium]
MKKILYPLLVLLLVGFSSCKKTDWLDWKAQNQLWLEQNKSNPDVKVTASGLQYKIIADPNPYDARPSASNIVTCTYTGHLINGAQFEGGMGYFAVNTLVAGFAEGIKKIHTNGDIVLYIPYDLGYVDEAQGTEGTQSYIPPYSTLIFNIHLDAVQ